MFLPWVNFKKYHNFQSRQTVAEAFYTAQLSLTLHSCALYSIIVLLIIFMQIKLQFDFTFVSVSTSLLWCISSN